MFTYNPTAGTRCLQGGTFPVTCQAKPPPRVTWLWLCYLLRVGGVVVSTGPETLPSCQGEALEGLGGVIIAIIHLHKSLLMKQQDVVSF